MKRVFKISLLLLVATVVLAVASYWLSLDRDFTHTAETARLPLYDKQMTSGLVRIEANGLTFRARIAGMGEGSEHKPLVILLHGFPSTSITWIDMLPILQAAGYRVVAFDQRGYSPGARPEGIESYHPGKRVADVFAVADVVGGGDFHLIGHDFGSITGWFVAMTHPERVLSWTGLSSPHPSAYMDATRQDFEQRRRGWYVWAIQIPWLAEIALGAFEGKMLGVGYDEFPEDKAREVRKVFAEPGAMTAALNWYRVVRIVLRQGGISLDPQIKSPTLFIWGSRDFSVSRWGIKRQAHYVDAPYRPVELDAGHWIVNDELDTVAAEILQHLETFREGRRPL